MKYLPREVAVGKLKAMVEAARMLRAEYAARDIDALKREGRP